MTIKADFSCVTASLVVKAIDEVVAAGTGRDRLILLVSVAQRRRIQEYLRAVSDPNTIRLDSTYSLGVNFGLFAGIPYMVSADVLADEIRIVTIDKVNEVGLITGLVV